MLKEFISEKLYLLALMLYWFFHPNRESVLVRQEGEFYRVHSLEEEPRFSEFVVHNIEMVQKPFAPCDLYGPYSERFEVERGDVVVDAGASAGEFTIPAAERAGEEGKVIAIEPEPLNIEILRANIEKRDLNNVEIVECALWDSEGEKDLQLDNGWGGHSLTGSDENKTIKVRTLSLDYIISSLELSGVDFIKMDVEGAKIEALRGAERCLEDAKKLAVAAYHMRNGEKTAERVEFFLRDRGFKVEKNSWGMVPAWREDIA